MSEDKKSIINLVPEPINNATKNLIDKPTQNIGTTLADIWYLVFGGISYVAEKRKLKYSFALQEFENELKEEIAKIPKNEMAEADMQIIAPALESAKYCIEKDELRKMFVNLISSSITKKTDYIPPLFVSTLSNLTTLDAQIINYLITPPYSIVSCLPPKTIEQAITNLSNLNLIESINPLDIQLNKIKPRIKDYMNMRNYSIEHKNKRIVNVITDINRVSHYNQYAMLEHEIIQHYPECYIIIHQAKLTSYGKSFMNICSIKLEHNDFEWFNLIDGI